MTQVLGFINSTINVDQAVVDLSYFEANLSSVCTCTLYVCMHVYMYMYTHVHVHTLYVNTFNDVTRITPYQLDLRT